MFSLLWDFVSYLNVSHIERCKRVVIRNILTTFEEIKVTMGIRFNKRIGGNRGFGINLSKSGLSSSYRSKFGSISPRGFSVRTGIPGLTFRSRWGLKKNRGSIGLILLIVFSLFYLAYYVILLAYNLLRLLWWIIIEIAHFVMRLYYGYRSTSERIKDPRISNREFIEP